VHADAAVFHVQVLCCILFTRLAVGYPGVVPARTLLKMAEQALDSLGSDSEARLCVSLQAPLGIALSVLANNNMCKQLEQERAIDLSLRTLQHCGARPCSAACLSLCLP
jgi:hypothetical protein